MPTIVSLRPAYGCIDVVATTETDAKSQLSKALCDARTRAILAEYGVSIDWFESEFLPLENP